MSLRLTTDHRVLQHITAFAAACVAASYLFAYVLRPITVPQPLPGYYIATLGKGELAVRNLQYLSNALRDDKTIVILGSSELNPAFSPNFTPGTFIPKYHLAKVISFGKYGFDTLGMYGLLSALRPHLNPGSRLVILLSPAWFRVMDLAPKTFNDDFDDNTLLQMYLDDDSSIVDWNLPGFITRTINSRAYSQREKLNLYLAKLAQPSDAESYDAGNGQYLPWGEYERRARTRELTSIAGNDLGVRNRYYRIYRKRRDSGITRYFAPNMNPEPEMNGVKLLLQLLKSSKVKALFVMQPLNPHIYDDIPRFYPLDFRIASLCHEYGMGYMDMYAAPYEEGVLGDAQHPGELGWEEIDHQVSEYFRL